ncbi:MAG: type II secretion system protein [Candidatus Paceibacterota bacterium]
MEPLHLHRGLALSQSKGFTLIELLVVLGVIMFVMAVVFTSQSTFTKTLILKNTAYDIALTLRSAQTFGLGSRANTDGGVTSVNAGYGLHFQSATPDSFILFADTSGGASCVGMTPDCKPGDHVYSSGADKSVQTYTLGNGIFVSDFCAYFGSGKACLSGTGFPVWGTSSLDIVFARPNPNVFIQASNLSIWTAACITLRSPQGDTRVVSIASSGAITADATSCP